MTIRAQDNNNAPEAKGFSSTTEANLSRYVGKDRVSCHLVPAGRAVAAIRDTSKDLRRIGMVLCVASSVMTLGSAVTLAVYLL